MNENEKIDLERQAYERVLREFTADRDLTDYDLTDHLELMYDIDPEVDRGYTIKVVIEVVPYS